MAHLDGRDGRADGSDVASKRMKSGVVPSGCASSAQWSELADAAAALADVARNAELVSRDRGVRAIRVAAEELAQACRDEAAAG